MHPIRQLIDVIGYIFHELEACTALLLAFTLVSRTESGDNKKRKIEFGGKGLLENRT